MRVKTKWGKSVIFSHLWNEELDPSNLSVKNERKIIVRKDMA